MTGLSWYKLTATHEHRYVKNAGFCEAQMSSAWEDLSKPKKRKSFKARGSVDSCPTLKRVAMCKDFSPLKLWCLGHITLFFLVSEHWFVLNLESLVEAQNHCPVELWPGCAWGSAFGFISCYDMFIASCVSEQNLRGLEFGSKLNILYNWI